MLFFTHILQSVCQEDEEVWKSKANSQPVINRRDIAFKCGLSTNKVLFVHTLCLMVTSVTAEARCSRVRHNLVAGLGVVFKYSPFKSTGHRYTIQVYLSIRYKLIGTYVWSFYNLQSRFEILRIILHIFLVL